MDKVAYSLMSQGDDTHWWFLARKKVFFYVLSQWFDRGGTWLEIGCGSGANLEMLKNFGNIQGVESDPRCAKEASENNNVPVNVASLPGPLPYLDSSMDAVVLFDVLEHVDEDQKAIAEIFRLLKPGGKVMIAVPAFSFLWSEHDVSLHHKRRYTRLVLEEKLKNNNFHILHSSYYNFWLFPIVLLARIAEKFFRKSRVSLESSLKVPPKLVNCTLTKILSSEACFVSRFRFPWGVSVFTVAEKPSTSLSTNQILFK